MRAGRLDRLVTIQRRAGTQDETGAIVGSWGTLATVPASYTPKSGAEAFKGEGFVARQMVEFRVRWDASFADLRPRDRLVYPGLEGSPEPEPTEGTIFDIQDVTELGRNEGFVILASRRVEA